MAPIHSRQLLVWTLPTIAALLSYLWYKRKRIGAPSDPGDKKTTTRVETPAEIVTTEKAFGSSATAPQTIVSDKGVEVAERTRRGIQTTPNKSFSRSLSGVESTPIDIVIPRELRSIKTAPVVISDEDLDFEIEKVKSMKNTNPIEVFNKVRTANGSPNNNNESDADKNVSVALNSYTASPTKSSPVVAKSIKIEATPFECKKTSPASKNETNAKKIVNVTQDSCTISPNRSSPAAAKSIKIEATPFECKKTTPTKINSVSTKTTPKKQKNKNKANMAQKDIAVVEQKLNTLKLQCNNDKDAEKKKDGEKKKKGKSRSSDREELHRQSSERDSANHSPADVMLASPSLSSISDNHSEGSNDSGKGCSDVATPPPSRTPGTDVSVVGNLNMSPIYEFVIPQNLVGKLIGTRGAFVTQINNKANAQVVVKRHPTDDRLKVCTIEGTRGEIEKALKMIRERFPLKKFPDVTLERVSLTHAVPTVPLFSDHLYLKLVAGINNDTIMSCMVTPGHLFLQQPTHPTFPNINILTSYMNICYSELDSPLLPDPIPENTICAAFSVDSWYRAIILSTNTETESSYVKFLDYGGYAYVENSMLRQIRGDFMLLPFQAAECFLANVKPIGESWHEDAYNLIADLTKGSIIYTQVIEYTDEDIPLVHCYAVAGPQQLVFLNQELVNQGFAEWVSYEEQESASAAGTTTSQEIAH